MYNPEGNTALGTIPANCIPYFVTMSPNLLKFQPAILPRIPSDYKLLAYFWCPRGSGNLYFPHYIIVPDHFSPTMAKPSKIPIAIRTRLTLSNGIRPVIHLDMPVIYTPPSSNSSAPRNSRRDLPPKNSNIPSMNKNPATTSPGGSMSKKPVEAPKNQRKPKNKARIGPAKSSGPLASGDNKFIPEKRKFEPE
jgi:hypothetical protein